MKLIYYFIIIAVLHKSSCGRIERSNCRYQAIATERVTKIREKLQKTNFSAYIVTPFDEHHSFKSEEGSSHNGRLQYISSFSAVGYAVMTLKFAALWTERSLLELADSEIPCDWDLFDISSLDTYGKSLSLWLKNKVAADSLVGILGDTVPHRLYEELERDLNQKYFRLKRSYDLFKDLLELENDKHDKSIRLYNKSFSGITWQKKIDTLRKDLSSHRCEAMVVTSLTDISWLLNLRGNYYIFVPVFKAYLIVDLREVILYTNLKKSTAEVQNILGFDLRTNSCFKENCVIMKDYDDVWIDLPHFSRRWKRVLLPLDTDLGDIGTSETMHSLFKRERILEEISPISLMRSVKNEAELTGMARAHVKDAVALCETLSYVEERFKAGEGWTENKIEKALTQARYEQKNFMGLAFKTTVTLGSNLNKNLLLIDSGGQYLGGTTAVSRIIHLGVPSSEQKKAYTLILTGLIRLAVLSVPVGLRASEIIPVLKHPLWTAQLESTVSAYGIGSFLSVEESPISIETKSQETLFFKSGNIFVVSMSHRARKFDMRLKNVYQVLNVLSELRFTGTMFKVATLVPFERNLIDLTLLNRKERKWLNEYNARIRKLVGEELKQQLKMEAFYWLLNRTEYIPESDSECRRSIFSNTASAINVNFPMLFAINVVSCTKTYIRKKFIGI